MGKKLLLSLLILLVVVQSAASQSRDSIYLADEMTLDLTLESRIHLIPKAGDNEIQYVTVDLQFLPIQSMSQEVLYVDTFPHAAIGDSVVFRWDEPQGKDLEYVLMSRLTTSSKFARIASKVPFPIDGIEDDVMDYVMPTDLIDINSDIQILASSLASGEDDLYQVVYNLAKWTKENVEYNLTTVTEDANKRSSWVLENRYGVCDEITNLFISMARSLGIPARFVSGISYSNNPIFDEAWGLHGWAEVYFPGYGWVPFDVTYGQLGYVDAGHIKLRDSLDSGKTSTRFEWKGYNMDLKADSLDVDVNIIEEGRQRQSPVSIDASAYASAVDFGSYNLMIADVVNSRDYYVASEFTLSAPREIRILGDRSQMLLIPPKQGRKIFWIVKVEGDLKKDYIYTFPMTVSSSMGASDETSFTSKGLAAEYSEDDMQAIIDREKRSDAKVYSRNIVLNCTAQGWAYVDEETAISCLLKNKGNVPLRDIDVCLSQDCRKIDLPISTEGTLDFPITPQEIGKASYTIEAESDAISASSNVVIEVVDIAAIEVRDLDYPARVKFGDRFDIGFTLVPVSVSQPKDVRLYFGFSDEKKEWEFQDLGMQKPVVFEIDSRLLDAGSTEFQIRLDYADANSRNYTKEQKITVTMDDLTIFQKIEVFFSHLFNGIARSVEGLV